ncbi:MAG: hypothetical protein CM1200mP39_16650 [Dehalococcoidia bacterium]|nr:MAG: hypothetical protein CM1200mP39_16650 [Dehalococcoidia bacterium]
MILCGAICMLNWDAPTLIPGNPDLTDGKPVILSDGTQATPTGPKPLADEPAAVPDGLQIVGKPIRFLERICLPRK